MNRARLCLIGSVAAAILLCGCGTDLDINVDAFQKASVRQTTYFTPGEAEYLQDDETEFYTAQKNGTTYYATDDDKTLSKQEFEEQGIGTFSDKYIALFTSNKLDFHNVKVTVPFDLVAGNGTVNGNNSMTFSYENLGGRPLNDMEQVYYAVSDEALLHGSKVSATGIKNGGKYKSSKEVRFSSSDGILQNVKLTCGGKSQYVNPYSISLTGTNKYVLTAKLIGGVEKNYTVWIDTEKPTANVRNQGTYAKGKKLSFKDKGCGVKSAKLDGKSVKSGATLKKSGSHKLVITDRAGNQTVIRFKIKWYTKELQVL